MRLLRLEEDSAFSLVEFVVRYTPCYAILSHTWGVDDEGPNKDVWTPLNAAAGNTWKRSDCCSTEEQMRQRQANPD